MIHILTTSALEATFLRIELYILPTLCLRTPEDLLEQLWHNSLPGYKLIKDTETK